MKKLMLGNQAVARGLYEAGCRFVSSYPGTPSTEITEQAALYDEIYAEWAPNEKVAAESAVGASLAGARSFCAMKHVGFNVAADPLFTAAYTGVNGGLVVCVADDPGMHSSQNEQDSRHYAVAAKLPMLEPSDSLECRDFVKAAYEISETFDTPAVLRTCTRVAHSQCLVTLYDREERALKPYEKNAPKYVAAPANAVKRHIEVEKRMEALRAFAETTDLNRVEMGDTSIGFVTSGTCYLYVKEAFPEASVLKLGLVNPLPVKLLQDFAGKVERLIVVEELDGVIEDHMRRFGIRVDGGKDLFGPLGELSQNRIRKALGAKLPAFTGYDEAVPGRPPVMCPGCPHRGLFTVLSKLKLTVLGDIGCYTLGSGAPLNAVDSVLCMGASRGEPGLQQVHRHGAGAGQQHHRHDRPSAEPHHGADAAERAHLSHQDRGRVSRRRDPAGAGGGPPGHGGHRGGHQRGNRRRRAQRHHRAQALPAAQVREGQAGAVHRPREVQGLPQLHEDRLSGDTVYRQEGQHRPHPVRGLRAVRADVQVRRVHRARG